MYLLQFMSKRQKSEGLITSLVSDVAPSVRKNLNVTVTVTEYLPPLMDIIQPTLRPVSYTQGCQSSFLYLISSFLMADAYILFFCTLHTVPRNCTFLVAFGLKCPNMLKNITLARSVHQNCQLICCNKILFKPKLSI